MAIIKDLSSYIVIPDKVALPSNSGYSSVAP